MRLNNNRGFTLVEMIVVTAIFVVIIMITGDAFKTILTQTMKLYKSEESNIEGVVGLEMFRHDLEQAGFGLPDSFQSSITYTEAANAPASSLNDANVNTQIPRPFVTINGASGLVDNSSESGNTYTIIDGTDYLAIKATSLGLTPAAQKVTYVGYTSNSSTVQSKPPQSWSVANQNDGDLVIVLRRTFQTGGGVTSQLVTSASGDYYTTYRSAGFLSTNSAFAPVLPGEVNYIYGILDKQSSTQPSSTLRMPFNRVDYFVAHPSKSELFPNKTCAPNTGILYKAVLDHSNGNLIYTPILDCVADMQVVLGWDLVDASGTAVTDDTLTGDGLIDTWTNADGTKVSSSSSSVTDTYISDNNILTDPGHIKTKLKVIKVYIMAQNGRKDPGYTSPNPVDIVDPASGEKSLTRPSGYTLTTGANDMTHYRWKVYRLVIKPKNLISNQQ